MTLLQQATVFIIEAPPHHTEALAQILVAANYPVQVCTEADLQPQAKLPNRWPNLIILQVAGGNSRGYELARQLKANPSTATIPLLFAGTFEDTASREQVFAAGGVDYLDVPVDAANVVARVGHWLGRSEPQPSRPAWLKDSLQRLHNSLDLDTILQTAIQDVRQQISADRAIIYQFGRQGRGLVTHEALADQSLTMLHRQVEDACFDLEHAAKYWSGRVGQIDDVDALGNISQCYRNMLVGFDIRANLVAPIIHNLPGQSRHLWGLIIVHQCDRPRRWQADEIALLQEISAHLAIAIQQSRLFEQVRHQARQEILLNHILDEIRASLDVQHILSSTVEHLGTALSLRQCGITLLRHNLDRLPTPFEVTAQLPHLSQPTAPLAITETLRQQLMLDDNVVLPYGVIPWRRRSNAAQPISQDGITYLATAIRIENQVQGVLWACPASDRPSRTDTIDRWQLRSDLGLIEDVALQLSQALQQAALYQQLQAAHDELQRLAHLDGLTQIANRREFDRYLAQEWQRLQREQGSLALVLADVDYFKDYNDSYGHLAGDDCLRSLAQLLDQVTQRPADLVARYGGEEFALILPNTTPKGAIALVSKAQACLARLTIPHRASPRHRQVTISCGIAVVTPVPTLSTDALIQRADEALYVAKKSGRNGYCLWCEDLQSA